MEPQRERPAAGPPARRREQVLAEISQLANFYSIILVGASFTVGYRSTLPGGTRGSSPPKNKKLPCIASRLLCEVGAALQRAAELGHVRRAPEATRADLGDSENRGEILTSPVRL